MNHAIIIAGNFERPDWFAFQNANQQGTGRFKHGEWPSIKRSFGAYRIASYLRENGWDVEVIDFIHAWSYEEFTHFIKQRMKPNTKFVGLSSLFWATTQGIVDDLNKKLLYIKENYANVPIIAGSQALNTNRKYLADIYVIGYGEKILLEIIKKLDGQSTNLMMYDFDLGGRIVKVANANIQHQSYPMAHLKTIYEERDFVQENEIISIEFSRGCRFKCKFCSYPILGVKGDYTRCDQDLEAELRDNYENWGVTNYSIADDTFNDSTEKVRKYSDMIRTLPFADKINMGGYIRADLIAAFPEQNELLASMGHWYHQYGIESFTPEAAKYVAKGGDKEKLKESLIHTMQYFNEHLGRYRADYLHILGLPHDTDEQFTENLKWLVKNCPKQFYQLHPLVIINQSNENTLQEFYSEFDRTWKQSGIFTSHTEEELGVNFDELKPRTRDMLRPYFYNDMFVKWKHDTSDFWRAAKLFDKLLDYLDEQETAPKVLSFHNYVTTGKYKMEDMNKSFNELETYDDSYTEAQEDFFEEYIFNKLSY